MKKYYYLLLMIFLLFGCTTIKVTPNDYGISLRDSLQKSNIAKEVILQESEKNFQGPASPLALRLKIEKNRVEHVSGNLATGVIIGVRMG